jgi:protein SCO1/2
VELADLIKDHTVVIYSFFTNCKASCPIMAHTLTELQPRFAGRLGKDLRFISITVDPENDTPARLKEYAVRNLAKEGWLFLTGSREEVDKALKTIDQYAPTPDQHQSVMLIGNDKTGLFMKAQALAKAKDLGDVIQKVADDDKK